MKSFILLFFLISFCCQADIKQALEFGSQIKNIVEKNEREAFFRLPCFPADCIDSDDINYVFGEDGNASFIKSFLDKPDVQIKVFGPFASDDLRKGSSFILMYYNPELVTFNVNGLLSERNRENLWWKGYIETVVHCQNGIFGFKETPFYHGAHLPWADDY